MTASLLCANYVARRITGSWRGKQIEEHEQILSYLELWYKNFENKFGDTLALSINDDNRLGVVVKLEHYFRGIEKEFTKEEQNSRGILPFSSTKIKTFFAATKILLKQTVTDKKSINEIIITFVLATFKMSAGWNMIHAQAIKNAQAIKKTNKYFLF